MLSLGLAVLLNGCSSFINRLIVRSIERVGDPIEPPPQSITNPILDGPEVAVSWVGHATTVVQIRDKVFVTDPLFTNTVGIILKRLVLPGVDPSLLEKVDYTVVSHTHFDHFSFGSLDMLPKNGTLLIPLGALQYTPEFGFRKVREMKPWDVEEEDGVRITAVPVQHFSGRYGIDMAWMRDHGYTGYVIEYGGYTVFFGGDTGYHDGLFKEIGRRFKVDVAILPIYPGSSGGLGSRIHVNPAGALKIFQDVGAKYMVPMHYSTITYGSDAPPKQPLEVLKKTAEEAGIAHKIVALDIGEQKVIFGKNGVPASSSE